MFYRFKLKPDTDIELAWALLESAGVEVLYSEESQEGIQDIYGNYSSPEPPMLPFLESCTRMDLPEINWQEQWQLHGYHYKDGFVHVNLQEFGFQGSADPIKLIPGAGFGDLSHATTRLLLTLMAKHLHGEAVLDVGCGSGILALAAIAMGAPSAIALDIDATALEHAYHNAVINGMERKIEFHSPESYTPSNPPAIALMNMISSEQTTAWNSLKPLHAKFKKVLTSGIPKAERKSYLKLTKRWGLNCLEENELDGWLGFYFSGAGQDVGFLPQGQQPPSLGALEA